MTMTWWPRILILLCFGIPVMVVAEQTSVQRARDWVVAQDFQCTLDDGYRCLEVAEKADTRPLAGTTIPAVYLSVWALCHRDFLTIEDLTPAQKELRHYRISFQETAKYYVVEFRGLLLPAVDSRGQVSGVLPAVFGRSIRYLVDKNSVQISSRLYMK